MKLSRAGAAIGLSIAAGIALAGCATSPSGPSYTQVSGSVGAPPATKARVIVYRPHYYWESSTAASVNLSDHRGGCLVDDERFFEVDLDPDGLRIAVGYESSGTVSALSFRLVAGQTYYVRIAPEAFKPLVGKILGSIGNGALADDPEARHGPFVIQRVDEADAQAELGPLTLMPGCGNLGRH